MECLKEWNQNPHLERSSLLNLRAPGNSADFFLCNELNHSMKVELWISQVRMKPNKTSQPQRSAIQCKGDVVGDGGARNDGSICARNGVCIVRWQHKIHDRCIQIIGINLEIESEGISIG